MLVLGMRSPLAAELPEISQTALKDLELATIPYKVCREAVGQQLVSAPLG
jgi:hypothetical protein